MIGIDPGVNTGFCVYNKKTKLIREIETFKIHEAMASVLRVSDYYSQSVFIRIEDARQRKWFGKNTIGKDQGAGSIKRDCTIWEDFLNDHGIPFEMVPPKNNITKLSASNFKKHTGITQRTSQHARDAAMLVYGF